MLAVHDVNVTLPGAVMTPGTEGSKAASEVLSPAQTDLRLLGNPQATKGCGRGTPVPHTPIDRGETHTSPRSWRDSGTEGSPHA